MTYRPLEEKNSEEVRGGSLVIFEMSKSVKKLVEEAKEQGYTDIDLCDRGLSNIKDIPGLSKFGSVS